MSKNIKSLRRQHWSETSRHGTWQWILQGHQTCEQKKRKKSHDLDSPQIKKFYANDITKRVKRQSAECKKTLENHT